jgi:hypothetical protein
LALVGKAQLRIAIAGRSRDRVLGLVGIVNSRAAAVGSGSRFAGHVIHWEENSSVAQLVANTQPKVILHTASLQSPWELQNRTSQWSKLVACAGFGVTLPLQSSLAIRLAYEIKRHAPRTLLVNACYPDAVNPVLRRLGLPITSGIGNVGILSAAIRQNIAKSPLQVIAHHYHVTSLLGDGQRQGKGHGPGIWIEHKRARLDLAAIETIRRASGDRLNLITSATVLPILDGLMFEKLVHTHAPGPNGLPGGYPILIRHHSISLELPKQVGERGAVAMNQDAANSDGIVVCEDGMISLSDRAMDALARHSRVFAQRFPVTQLSEVSSQLLELRRRLA